jgi:hypothetical protein
MSDEEKKQPNGEEEIDNNEGVSVSLNRAMGNCVF